MRSFLFYVSNSFLSIAQVFSVAARRSYQTSQTFYTFVHVKVINLIYKCERGGREKEGGWGEVWREGGREERERERERGGGGGREREINYPCRSLQGGAF